MQEQSEEIVETNRTLSRMNRRLLFFGTLAFLLGLANVVLDVLSEEWFFAALNGLFTLLILVTTIRFYIRHREWQAVRSVFE